MWKAAVFVFLLMSMDVQANVSEDKTIKAEAVITSPASDSASPPYLGKLLVIPMDGSHWVDIKAHAQEMGRRGHSVTVVIPEFSMRMGPGKHYDTVTYPVPYTKADIDHVMSTNKDILEKSEQTFIMNMKNIYSLFNNTLITHLAQQVALLEPLMCRLMYWHFDTIAHQFLGEKVGVAAHLSVFWTEFGMRHKGAKHLRAAVRDLHWFQYFCLDVIAFLATVVLVFVIVTVKCFKLCCRKLSRKRKQE